jgi:hypothetical protein
MNIAVQQRGLSFDAIEVKSYGPDLGQLLIADFYYGYHFGNTSSMSEHISRRQFARRIRQGRLICHSVFVGEMLVAVFGTAIRQDDDGPFVEIEFFLGDLGRNFRPVLRAMVMCTYRVARAVAMDRCGFQQHVRVRVRGRKGWRRALARVACRVDADGWCHEFDPLERWS